MILAETLNQRKPMSHNPPQREYQKKTVTLEAGLKQNLILQTDNLKRIKIYSAFPIKEEC